METYTLLTMSKKQFASFKNAFLVIILLASAFYALSGCSNNFTGVTPASIKTNSSKTTGDQGLNSFGQGGNPDGVGDHLGELQFLVVKVDYIDPYFMRDDKYPGYYIGLPMKYKVTITNTGSRTFEHLDIMATHEYFETDTIDRWWYPYPEIYTYFKDQPLPGDSTQTWSDISLAPGQSIVLEGVYTAPLETGSGLDQTHIRIKHTNEGPEHAALIYDNPIAGVFCPPPVPKN